MTLGVRGWGESPFLELKSKPDLAVRLWGLEGSVLQVNGGSFVPGSCGHLTLASPISFVAVQGLPPALFASKLGTHPWLC